MHFLIIKGPPFRAVLEAKKRRCDIMLTQSRSEHETWAYSCASWRELSDWFTSDAHEQAPFQNGSLLWYRDLEVSA